MAHRTIADQLVAQIVAAGARHVYGIVGDSLNPVVDAVRRAADDGVDIAWVHVRHEEAGAFAAAAEAELTGRLAVCAGSCGPGNLHLINGLYDAHRSRVPVLAIASHIPSAQIGTQFFQETHPDRLFLECSAYSEMITSAAQAPRVIRSAIHHAYGAPGVAVLTLPGDVAELEAADDGIDVLTPAPAPRVVPADESVRALAAAIDAADRVTIFAGAGVRGSRDEVLALAEKLAAPIGHSLRGKEVIQYDNPFDVGMTGLLGYGACAAALEGADLILLLGTDFPYPEFLPDVPTAQVDIEPTRLGRRTRNDLAVLGDVGETLRAVLPLVRARDDRRFLEKMLSRQDKAMSGVVGAYTKDAEDLTPIHPELAASILDEEAPEDAVFAVDTGMGNVWAARYITPNGRRRVIGSFLHGSMANALPHAIGAALAQPSSTSSGDPAGPGGTGDEAARPRAVVAIAGDGGLSMLLGELITLRALDLPVKVIVFDNASLAMVRLEMLVAGVPSYATDSPAVDYAAIAAAVGIPSVRVEDPRQIRSALREAFSHDGPALVDLVTDPRALSLPPKITRAQVSGFTRAMAKQVIGGGVADVVAMARSNIRNVPR